MNCRKCNGTMRTTYLGIRGSRGDYCFKCGKKSTNKRLQKRDEQ
jgi:hypothetical protein